MKQIIIGLIIGLALGGAATWTALQRVAHEEEKKEEHKEEARFTRGTNGQVILKLDKKTQERAGLRTFELKSAAPAPEIKGYGRVLDPAPLAAIAVEISSASAALDASTREFQRLRSLYAQNQNVSTRALENAEANMKRDEILTGAARLKLVTSFGQAMATQPDLPAFVRQFSAHEILLARVDLNLGDLLDAAPLGGRIAAAAAETHPIDAELFGAAPSADLQTQGQGFFFLLRRSPLQPGTALVGWLRVPGQAVAGVIVPREALIRHEGEVFAYVRTGDETYARKEIELDRPLSEGWFVREGLKPGDQVVIVGAQQLLSEELKGKGGAE